MVLKSFHTATTDFFLCNAMTVQPRMECKDNKRKLVIIIALPPHTATVVIQDDRTPLGVYHTAELVEISSVKVAVCWEQRPSATPPSITSLHYSFKVRTSKFTDTNTLPKRSSQPRKYIADCLTPSSTRASTPGRPSQSRNRHTGRSTYVSWDLRISPQRGRGVNFSLDPSGSSLNVHSLRPTTTVTLPSVN